MFEIYEVNDLLEFTSRLGLKDRHNKICEICYRLPPNKADQLVREAFYDVLDGNSNRSMDTIYVMTTDKAIRYLSIELERRQNMEK